MDKKTLKIFLTIMNNNHKLSKFCYYNVRFSTNFFFAMYFCVGIYYALVGDARLTLYITTPLICFFTVYLLRKIVRKLRPYVKYNFKLEYSLRRKMSFSFPSNHASSSMVIAFALSAFNIYIGLILFIFAIILGLSRALLGIHFISDILAGWGIGIIFGIIGFWL